MNEYIISVGSNIDPKKNIDKARSLLHTQFTLLKESEFLETKPEEFTDQAPFLNGAFLIQTELNRDEVKRRLLATEEECGRVRTENKNGPRTIDLDITMVNGEVCDKDYEKYWFVKETVDQLLEKDSL